MLNSFLNHRVKSITSAALILAGASLVTKILSLIRIRIFTTLFTVSELDIYFAAFRIPDLLYNILILGAISTAFIPVFAEYWSKSKKEAWQLSNNLLFVFLFLLIFLSIPLIIFSPQLMRLVTPGFKGEKMAMVVTLTRIMFLSPILLGISNILGSILQYFSRFLVYSLAPILYNIGIILGAIFFTPKMGILGLGFGVVLGAFLHLLTQLPALFLPGYQFRAFFNFNDQGIKKIFKLMIPRTIGLAAQQINLIVITAIASLLMAGSVTIFNVSFDLQYVPISLFGISFATAAFPSLSRSFFKKNKESFFENFTFTFSKILFFILPVSILFFILRVPIVRIIPGSQNYTWQDTWLTAASLGLFSFSIFAQGLIPLLAKTFYSFQDTKTPVKLSIFSIIFNIIFSVFFVRFLSSPNSFYYFMQSFFNLKGISQFSVLGLPLAFSLSSILNLGLLLFSLKRKTGSSWDLKLASSFLRILVLSLLCGGITFGLLFLSSPFFNLKSFAGIFLQTIFAGGGGVMFYLLSAKLLNFPEYKLIFQREK